MHIFSWAFFWRTKCHTATFWVKTIQKWHFRTLKIRRLETANTSRLGLCTQYAPVISKILFGPRANPSSRSAIIMQSMCALFLTTIILCTVEYITSLPVASCLKIKDNWVLKRRVVKKLSCVLIAQCEKSDAWISKN